MPGKNIITGGDIPPKLRERAKQLRREMTPAEVKLWQRLRAGRLEGYHFRRQQIIDRFIGDFYCHQSDFVVEVDGGVHFEQADYDQQRDLHLRRRGLRVLRFTNADINKDLEGVLAAILEACQQSAGQA